MCSFADTCAHSMTSLSSADRSARGKSSCHCRRTRPLLQADQSNLLGKDSIADRERHSSTGQTWLAPVSGAAMPAGRVRQLWRWERSGEGGLDELLGWRQKRASATMKHRGHAIGRKTADRGRGGGSRSARRIEVGAAADRGPGGGLRSGRRIEVGATADRGRRRIEVGGGSRSAADRGRRRIEVGGGSRSAADRGGGRRIEVGRSRGRPDDRRAPGLPGRRAPLTALCCYGVSVSDLD